MAKGTGMVTGASMLTREWTAVHELVGRWPVGRKRCEGADGGVCVGGGMW